MQYSRLFPILNDTYYKYMIEAFGGSKSKETVERGIIKKLTPFVKIKGL